MLDTTELALRYLPRATLFGTYICEMNAIATAGLCSSAGRYRTETARINNSDHIPRKLGLILPGANPVPSYWHANRDTRYYEALAAADKQPPDLPEGPVKLRELLKRAVLNQLNSVPWQDET